MLRFSHFFIFVLLSFLFLSVNSPCEAQELRWYKGNTHAHTLNSDGDSTPDEVVRWYREQGYNFLVLTDHNFLTSVDGLNALHGAEEQFLVIKGEEVTDKFGDKPIHVNGLNIANQVEPQGGNSVAETIQRNVDAVREESGVPHINHPNYRWAITAEDLKRVSNYKLFEIFNGHPYVNNESGGGTPGLEEVWDMILSSGKLVYGIAVDDAHHFKRPWDKTAALPGQGWVVVRAERLSASLILQAMERGDFYASTGVELENYKVDEKSITIKIKPVQVTRYRVQFIGKGGAILSEAVTNPATYQFTGNEMYVRAKIIDSNGKVAWTQPVMPMVDHSRTHERVQIDTVSGKRFEIDGLLAKPIEAYLPQRGIGTDSLRLLIHFHGTAYVAIHAVEKSQKTYFLACMNLGSGSSVYEKAFLEEGSFARLVNSLQDSLALRLGEERKFAGIYLSAFSAGYGSVRAILNQPDAPGLVDGIILLDGLHTDYVPEGQVLAEGGVLNIKKLSPFLNFAKLAIDGKKVFIITHSEIFPGSYASTTETADYLIQECGLSRKPVLRWGVLGMQQTSEVKEGKFIVLGFAGNSAPDHVDHFHALFKFLSDLD